RGGQARGGTALAEVMEAAVGALGRAFAGEHAGGILTAAAVRIHAAGVWVMARQVLAAEEADQLAPVLRLRRRHFRDLLVAERVAVVLDADDLVAHLVFVDVGSDRLVQSRPLAQLVDGFVAEFFQRGVVALAEEQEGAVDDVFVMCRLGMYLLGLHMFAIPVPSFVVIPAKAGIALRRGMRGLGVECFVCGG